MLTVRILHPHYTSYAPHILYTLYKHITLNLISQSGLFTSWAGFSWERKRGSHELTKIKACSFLVFVFFPPTCTLTHPRSTKKALPQSHSHKQNLSALLYCTSYPRMIKYGLKMPTRPRRGRTWLLFFTIPPVSSSDCMPLVPLKLRIINIQW